jgi:hypothetical protein
MKNLCLAVFLLASIATYAQNRKTENLVIITLDGYRWKELFTGADSFLVVNKKFMPGDSTALVKKYWATTPQERRKMLMPFVWTTVAKDGQLYGNRTIGNNVNVKNKYWFSYPGYNEIFTGYPDSAINSNDYPPNPNVNVLEYINKQSTYKNKVAVFASWNAYYRILNEERSGLYINAGWSELKDSDLNATQKTLNEQQAHLPHIFGETERLDGSTYALATEYLKKNHPKVLYLAFIDTDAFGHQGKYDLYLDAAHYIDAMIGELWNYLQQDPFYKGKTTLLITNDHGRGYEEKWTGHYYTIPHSDEIWFAAMGPDTKPLGEVTQPGQLFQNQIAKTIARLLGMNFTTQHEIGEPIHAVLRN